MNRTKLTDEQLEAHAETVRQEQVRRQNLTKLTDEQLEAHAETVRQEQVRRQNLTQTPETIARLAQQYRDAGGDQAELETAVAS